MGVELLDLIQNDKEVAKAVDILIMTRVEIKADDLEKMSDEQYEILEPFIDKYYNEDAVKEILMKHINQGKAEKKNKIEIRTGDIVEPLINMAIAEFNDNDEARAAFWAVVFEQSFEGKSRKDFRDLIINLAKDATKGGSNGNSKYTGS